MLPYIYRELVIKRKWFGNNEIVDIFTVAQSIPGAIAVNAAFNTGFRKAGFWGGIMAATGVVLPAFMAIVLILFFFMQIRDAEWVRKFLAGVITASAALIFLTTIDISKTVLKKNTVIRLAVAVIVFITIGMLDVNALWLILAGMFFGLFYHLVIKGDVKIPDEKHEKEKKE